MIVSERQSIIQGVSKALAYEDMVGVLTSGILSRAGSSGTKK